MNDADIGLGENPYRPLVLAGAPDRPRGFTQRQVAWAEANPFDPQSRLIRGILGTLVVGGVRFPRDGAARGMAR